MRCLPVFLCMIICARWLQPTRALASHSFSCWLLLQNALLHWLCRWAAQNCVVLRTADRMPQNDGC